MANEILGSVSLCIAQGPRRAFTGLNFGLTLSSEEIVLQDQSIGTGAELLDFGDVTPSFIAIVNQDPTNYVELGLDSGVSTKVFARIKAGGFALWFPYSGVTTIYAKANTAQCKCAMLAIEGATLGTVTYQTSPVLSPSCNATAALTLSGSSGVRGISLSATKGWNAVGSDDTDDFIPFCHQEITGAGVTLTGAVSAITAAGGFMLNVNPGDSGGVVGYMSLVNDGSDKVCTLPVQGGFCVLPVKPSGQLYCGEADSVHVPLFVTY